MNHENGLIAHDSLNPENISYADYANTLAAEALRVGIYTESDVTQLQNGLMNTLADVIGYHSENHSTSVKTDAAREMAQSILYNVDTYLRSLGNNMTAIEELRTKRMSDLYGKGYLINSKWFEQAKVLYARVRYTRLKNGSAEYNKTIDVKLKNYFSSYDARFNAHSKAYITLSEYGIRGAYRINELSAVLAKLIDINTGKKADVTIDGNVSST